MGNSLRHADFVRLVKEGPDYLIHDQWVWTEDERNALLEFFHLLTTTLRNPKEIANMELPWRDLNDRWPNDRMIQDYFSRVCLAVPKTNRMVEIYKHAGSEMFRSPSLQTEVQLAHIYSAVLFLWSLYQKSRPDHPGQSSMVPVTLAELFYQSDLLDAMAKEPVNNEAKVNHQRVKCMISALEKISIVNSMSAIPQGQFVYLSEPGYVLSGTLRDRLGNPVTSRAEPDFYY